MAFMRLTDIHQREHHENERLQEHDQDVEDGPQRTGNHVADEAESSSHRTQQGDQQEQQLDRKSVV